MKKYIAVVLFTLALLLLYLLLVSGSKKDDMLPVGESIPDEQTGIVIDVTTATAEEIVSVLYQELPNDDGSGVLVTGGM